MKYTQTVFDDWNIEKKRIDQKNIYHTYIKPWSIWFCSLWHNIWSEENGKWHIFSRPVLVLSKIGNMYCVVPLTTWWKENHPFYYTITSISFHKPSRVILTQIKTLDIKRFIDTKHKISYQELLEIKKILRDMYLPEL